MSCLQKWVPKSKRQRVVKTRRELCLYWVRWLQGTVHAVTYRVNWHCLVQSNHPANGAGQIRELRGPGGRAAGGGGGKAGEEEQRTSYDPLTCCRNPQEHQRLHRGCVGSSFPQQGNLVKYILAIENAL